MAKPSSPSRKISGAIEERGPLTVAAFMDLALYDAEIGYYARVARRSGRAGDFFTSVDVGPIFGQLIARQVAEMANLLTVDRRPFAELTVVPSSIEGRLSTVDLVEAGAGDGRLAADILRAAREQHPSLYSCLHLHLVEASASARMAQAETLGDLADRLASSGPDLPESFEGILLANELLDAMPVHQIVMREDGLREVYVAKGSDSDLHQVEGPLSTPAIQEYLTRIGVELEPGSRAEINLHAVEWVRDAARRLRRGFMILIDYGHEARELYSAAHAGGTLTTFTAHTMGAESSPARTPPWLRNPGERDITSHVDFTSIRAAAEAEGLQTLGFLDQTYFLLGMLKRGRESFSESPGGIGDSENDSRPLKTLLMPGGLGSTHKVLILGKGVGMPALAGCSYRVRVT